MNKVQSLIIVLVSVAMFSCESRFPVEKRFWSPEDYKKVWFEIKFETPDGEEYPRFSNPETAVVVRKIVDPQNYEAILGDSELGLNYRNEVSQDFFEAIQDLSKVYSGMDVQDKFIYAEELAEIDNFFLGFQILYFKVGNENIANQSDDKSTIRSNEQTIIGNFISHLQDLRKEKSYGQYAPKLADGINLHFHNLIETFPNANYVGMLSTAKTVQAKVQTPEIKTALSGLVAKLETIASKTAETGK